jgi:hypothetical protein
MKWGGAAHSEHSRVFGSVYGKNQIFCGNVNSTEWLVTQYKSSGQVSGTPQFYCLSSPGTFDPAVNHAET